MNELKTPAALNDPQMKSTNSMSGEGMHSSRPKRPEPNANPIKIEKVDPKSQKISPTKTQKSKVKHDPKREKTAYLSSPDKKAKCKKEETK